MDEQTQLRPRADVDDGRRESREWASTTATRCLTSADNAEKSSLETTNAPAARHRRASIPTFHAVRGPWLFKSRSPGGSDRSSAVARGHYRRPPAFTRRHSSPLTTTTPSPLKCRRHTEIRFPSSDRERRTGREPAWLSEMTPRQQRGSMSLHCCVAIVSRCLHAAGARRYGAYIAEECQRRRRLTDKLDVIDDRLIRSGWQFTGGTSPVSDRGHIDAVARAHQTDDGQRRTLASSHRRSVIVTDCRPAQRNETCRRARHRSGRTRIHHIDRTFVTFAITLRLASPKTGAAAHRTPCVVVWALGIVVDYCAEIAATKHRRMTVRLWTRSRRKRNGILYRAKDLQQHQLHRVAAAAEAIVKIVTTEVSILLPTNRSIKQKK